MSTTQEAEQHLVLFVAAGDGSDAAIEAVARKLAEKFDTPFERMRASVRQTPRVFKRNMSLQQAESCATMLRSMGAVAEVQPNGSNGTAAPAAPAASPPAAEPPAPAAIPEPVQAATPAPKPPPPEVLDQNCPFCGRDLQAGGVCVICKPREVGPDEPAAVAAPEVPTVEIPAIEVPEINDPGPLSINLPAKPPVEHDLGFQDPLQSQTEEDPAAAGIEVGPTAPAADPLQPDTTALDESASIENDLSALLSPENLGVCPNCCGPMEQDGTCLICPPPDPSQQPAAQAEPDLVDLPQEMMPDIPTAEPEQVLPEQPDGIPMETPPETPEPAQNSEASPFDSLAPLNAEPERDSADVCTGCGGPKGSDGTCLICGEDVSSGGSPETAAHPSPDTEEMAVTRNEPPPAEPVIPEIPITPAVTDAAADSAEEKPEDERVLAAESEKKARPAAQKKGRGFDLSSLPRGLTIPLMLTLLLLTGGIAMAVADKFIIATGVYSLALITGLVAVAKAIGYLQQTVSRFPKLPKIVIIVFILFLFFAGSSSIIGYALKQSAIYLFETHGEQIQAEVARLAEEEGLLGTSDADAGMETSSGEGSIIPEEEMLDRAITAEGRGEENPRAALENWQAYLEGFPDGSQSSEARRRISHWKAIVGKEDALNKVIARDRHGNGDPDARIRDWQSCLATYGNTQFIRDHAEERIDFWESMREHGADHKFPYWASLRTDDGREFSGKVIAENDYELKMELPNRLKMKFRKSEFELIESDHITGKRLEAETMLLMSGVATDKPTWGREDGFTILGDDRSGVITMVKFPATGFYHFEVMARADKDQGGFPSVLLSLNGEQQERIRFISEEWQIYKVAFPFRIPAGEHRLEILFPPHYQTMKDKRTVAIDYFTTSMLE